MNKSTEIICDNTTENTEGDSPVPKYFQRYRADVISIIPPNAQCILSVGCAAGTAEEELVKRGIKVVGVELNHQAANKARQRGVIVLEGNASEIDVSVAGDSYDCLIYADILEHLSDPLAVLKRHVELLKPGGIVYISVPNFRNYSVGWQLFIRGKIMYEDAGILDRTHIRITTRKMILEWFDQAGIECISCQWSIWKRRHKLLSSVSLGLLKEFLASQVRLVGKKPLVHHK